MAASKSTVVLLSKLQYTTIAASASVIDELMLLVKTRDMDSVDVLPDTVGDDIVIGL